MKIQNFRFQIITRIILIILFISIFFLLIFQTELYATMIFIGILIVYQIVALIRFAETTNRRLSQFLQSIRYSDFLHSFSGRQLGKSFTELDKAFSDIMTDFQKERSEKEEHYRYLQTVVQHVGIALIVYQKDGKVELINPAARKLFHLSQLHHLSNLENEFPALVNSLVELGAGERSLVKIVQNGEVLQLAVYATKFRLRNQLFTLASIQNIQSELEEREMEAWQKLIRVLTHEIMNSVTPISSLAATVNEILRDLSSKFKVPDDTSESVDDMSKALQTIQKRSEGLLHFVEAYRSLTRLPQPKLREFSIAELFNRMQTLTYEEMKKSNIYFEITTNPPGLKLTADPEQIEQVLLNLLKNAIEAVQDSPDPEIQLRGYHSDGGRVVIQVIDNGPGIAPEIREKIFIPFFTTKKQGSGIGLSLSRQIIRLHKGTITANMDGTSGSIFTLRI
jgi:nitrogen fixation/metabolism regulation signal transduction histidine kinase